MRAFEINFLIDKDALYCAACSDTIIAHLKTFRLPLKIKVNILTKIVQIKLDSTDMSTAQSIANELTGELGEIGRNLDTSQDTLHQKKSCHIIDLDLEEPEGTSEFKLAIQDIPQPKELPKTTIIFPIFSIASGSVLMLAEHKAWVPKDASGKIINALIGGFATIMTGFLGKGHFKQAARSLRHCSPASMDYLISLGSLCAIAYSYLLIFGPLDETKGHKAFDVPLILLGFLKLSHDFRDRLHVRIETHIDRVNTAKKILPKRARVLSAPNETPKKELVKWVEKLSLIEVLPLEIVPIDGTLENKNSALVREVFFGELGDSEKKPGAIIYAGAVNKSNHSIVLKTCCEASDNHLSRALEEDDKSIPEPGLLEQVVRYFFPAVLLAAGVSATAWALWGPDPKINYALEVLMSVIYSACPCSFGLMKILPNLFKSLALEHGILITNDRALAIDQVQHICIDKTGTMTKGKFIFSGIIFNDEKDQPQKGDEYLAYATIIEEQIPRVKRNAIASAIIEASKTKNIDLKNYTCESFETNPMNEGRGGRAVINGHAVILGNKPLLDHLKVNVDASWIEQATRHAQNGNLPLFLAVDNKLCALIILEPVKQQQQEYRLNTEAALHQLFQYSQLHILTGDTKERAEILLTGLLRNIEIKGEMTPLGKQAYTRQLMDNGERVIVVGDEINDCPAMKSSNCGIAIDSMAPASANADVVLNGSLMDLVKLMGLAKLHRSANKLSLLIAFGLNLLAIIASAGAFYPLTDHLLDPVLMGLIMGISSLLLMVNFAVFQRSGRKILRGEIPASIGSSIFVTDPTQPLLVSADSLNFSS